MVHYDNRNHGILENLLGMKRMFKKYFMNSFWSN